MFIWGVNHNGELGDGTEISKSSPIEITSQFNLANDERIISMSLGINTSSALTSTGRLFTWGINDTGQLGNEENMMTRSIPAEITPHFNLSSDETIKSMSLGVDHSSALTSTGRLFTWGNNDFGQLGDGTTINKLMPTDITSQFNLTSGEIIISVSLGRSYSSALTSTGRVFTWGQNSFGQLGDGTTDNKLIPTEITSQFNLLNNDTVSLLLSSGVYHSSALTSTGRLFTWGINEYGQLGDGTTINKLSPTEITSQFILLNNETISSLSLGYNHSLALTSSGRMFSWGSNSRGQLGDGTITNKLVPIEITEHINLSNGDSIITTSAGSSHSIVLTSTSEVFTFGSNYFGQLGDGTTTTQLIPQLVGFKLNQSTDESVYEYQEILSENLPTRDGYTFDGWYIDEDLTIPFFAYSYASIRCQFICKLDYQSVYHYL